MATNGPIQIPVPQSQGPQFPAGAVSSLVEGYLNRPNGAMVAQQGIGNAINSLASSQQYNQARQLEAIKAYAELYGQGGPNAVQNFAPVLNKIAGNNVIPSQATPQMQAPMAPTNSSQLAPIPSQLIGQAPAAQLDSGISEPIKLSVEQYGHPDFTGHLARIRELQGKMAGFDNQGAYGQKQTQQLSQDIIAEKAAMDAEMLPQTYQKQAQDLAMGQRKPVADEASKQGENINRTGQLRSLFNDMKTAVAGNKPSLMAGISGAVANTTGGRLGNTSAANVQNVAAPFTAALNYELTKRFNEGEASFLMNSLMPKPNDTPAFANQKMQRLDRMISAIESGNEQNIQNVASVIHGGSASTRTSQPMQTAWVPKVGQAYKGHIFLGGDPSSQASWRKQ